MLPAVSKAACYTLFFLTQHQLDSVGTQKTGMYNSQDQDIVHPVHSEPQPEIVELQLNLPRNTEKRVQVASDQQSNKWDVVDVKIN